MTNHTNQQTEQKVLTLKEVLEKLEKSIEENNRVMRNLKEALNL